MAIGVFLPVIDETDSIINRINGSGRVLVFVKLINQNTVNTIKQGVIRIKTQLQNIRVK